jgi:hypothetical protein
MGSLKQTLPGAFAVDCRVERGIVVHFHLPVEFEASFTGKDVAPERI